jgi:hypothetical protein
LHEKSISFSEKGWELLAKETPEEAKRQDMLLNESNVMDLHALAASPTSESNTKVDQWLGFPDGRRKFGKY